MYNPSIKLGVMPTRRVMLPLDEAIKQKNAFMPVIKSIKPEIVTVVDIDDVCNYGIASDISDAKDIICKFKEHNIDAIIIPFCDFGDETVVATVASSFSVPVLIWANRDEMVNTDIKRGRDSQCGMFAATKVLRRFGVTYSYIYNCETVSEEFRNGLECFIRVSNILKDLKGLRIARFGDRPPLFMSVITNEAELLRRFGISTLPVSLISIEKLATEILSENGEEYQAYLHNYTKRIDCSTMDKEYINKYAAVKLAVQRLMDQNNCSVATVECGLQSLKPLGVFLCPVLGEMASQGKPIACETDINGAITMTIMRACLLGEAPGGFLADLTVRHPTNDNAELLWHCGVFPYALKAQESNARLIGGRARWEMKQGEVTICRFDDAEDDYYLFTGECNTTTGPETIDTYVWIEVDNWKLWEQKLMFGPYIHHVGCMYGRFSPVLREVARYLKLKFDTPETDGPKCL